MQFQETAEILICWNCANLIANGDCLECITMDANTGNAPKVCPHGPDESCAGWEISVGEEDSGYALRTCWSCGQELMSDQWCHATAFMYTAEHWVMRATALLVAARSIREGLWLAGDHASPAALLDTASEYGRRAVNARRYATES